MKENDQVAAVAFTILDPGNPSPKPLSKDMAWFMGCGHLVCLEKLRRLGGYGAFPGKYGCEEKDLCIRLLDRGYVIRGSSIKVWHEISFKARDLPRLHASGVCNDLTFLLMRCPFPRVLHVLPRKLLGHFTFAFRYLGSKSKSRGSFDEGIQKRWGKGVFVKPVCSGFLAFLKGFARAWKLRSPVADQTFQVFRRKTLLSFQAGDQSS